MSSSANRSTTRKRGSVSTAAKRSTVSAEPTKRSAAGTSKRTAAGTIRRSTRNVEAVDDGSNCIDLTCECDDEIVVDLTTVEISPVRFRGDFHSTASARNGRRRRVRPELTSVSSGSSFQPVSVCLLDDFEVCLSSGQISPELPEVDFGQYSCKQPEPEPARGSLNNRVISCPICFDTDQEIAKNGNHLMSTTCGHIFCKNCISESIQKNRCCPTCRKRLTTRQIHQIFL
uniref:RING-type domain-containing protein n=1 Tax=Strigamia maritima TaxID=126957 RepID=T1IQJ1_STRMM